MRTKFCLLFLIFLILLFPDLFGQSYSLSVFTVGGAKPQLVDVSPSGTLENGILTFPKGTQVTLTANSNPVFGFSRWMPGETDPVKVITINEDTEIVAQYDAKSYIVGWDFYAAGNNNRTADYYATEANKNSSLNLNNQNGTTSSWSLFSGTSSKLWFGKYCAVIWKGKNTLGNYYFQITFDSRNFENIRVNANMLGVFSYYHTQNIEYSLDGETFVKLGSIKLDQDSVWYNGLFTLPVEANQREKVYLRFIADLTSELTVNGNEGTSISDIYILADPFNDGIAPVLLSSTPVAGANDVFEQGKIVLTFDEKVKLSEDSRATLNGVPLKSTVEGKTIKFEYSGLSYNTGYEFILPENMVSDLSGNTISSAIQISFTTMERPGIEKKKFDFVVGTDGTFKEALAAAKRSSSIGKRFYIFFPNGEYNIGELTGDSNQMTTIDIPLVSYIGQNADSVLLFNKSIKESIGTTATIYFTSSSNNIYMQDLSLMNKMDYRTGVLLGRAVALRDQGKKSIYKNVKLLSNQDTYYTGSDRTYLESCEIHGTVDFICGGGDIYFNQCLLYLENRSGNCLTAPASSGKWGYVFMDCTIDGFAVNNNSFRLGRSWSNSPKCVYINTIMKKLPSAIGWGDPMNVVPSVFAEYNSMTASGSPVELGQRRTTYTKDGNTVTLNPVLSEEQAATYTLANVLRGNDSWKPEINTVQIPAPKVTLSGGLLNWENNSYALCWAIFKNGKFVECTTNTSYTVPEGTLKNTCYTVRAANQMGGLGNPSEEVIIGTSVQQISQEPVILDQQFFSPEGKLLQGPVPGFYIVRTRYSNGQIKVQKMIKTKY